MTSLNLSNMSVGELVSTLRDAGFFIGILYAGWKGRALLQPAIDFFKTANTTMRRLNQHMVFVENGMNTLLVNHVAHIEQDLAVLAGRHVTNHEHVAPIELTELAAQVDAQINEGSPSMEL